MFFVKKKSATRYSDLSSREKKKLITKSIRDANREQLDLVKEYDKKYGELKHAG